MNKNLGDLSNNVKQLLRIVRAPEEERRRTENVFKAIMAEVVPNLILKKCQFTS